MTIPENIEAVRQQITGYCRSCNRDPGSVLLLAVSKTKPPADIASAYQAGLCHFGENYCQEALIKQHALGAYNITWHFIGPIQSNKTKLLAQHFSWVHSVDSLKIARRLNEQRPDNFPPLNICLQVNISGETSKSGIKLAELPDLCAAMSEFSKLKLRGVMAIPEPQDNVERQRQPYRTLTQAVKDLQRPDLTTLSFGMSGDLQAAIMEGATIVRVGTALFGSRNAS
ncbi:Pyridoxal phosphate homeostasis protein [biofilm metagenome]